MMMTMMMMMMMMMMMAHSVPAGFVCLRSDGGGHQCLPAGLAIALAHQLARFLLGAFLSQFAGRWARPTPISA